MTSTPAPDQSIPTSPINDGKQTTFPDLLPNNVDPRSFSAAPIPPKKLDKACLHERELRLERTSPEEKRHERFRVAGTYFLINAVVLILINISIAPILTPHEVAPIASSRAGQIVWRVFRAFWGVLTAFYNLMLGCYAWRHFGRKWAKEDADSHLNQYRIPSEAIQLEKAEAPSAEQDLQSQLSGWNSRDTGTVPGTAVWFSVHNPYTAARRTHGGTFLPAQREGRFINPDEQDPLQSRKINIPEESKVTGKKGAEQNIKEGKAKAAGKVAKDVLETTEHPFDKARETENYPFPKGEEIGSSTTWSNSATSAGEFYARKKRKSKGKGKGKSKDVSQKQRDGIECSSPTCAKQREGITSRSSSLHSCAQCSASANSWGERERILKKAIHQAARNGNDNPGNEGISIDGPTAQEAYDQEHTGYHDVPLEDEETISPQQQRLNALQESLVRGSYHEQQAMFTQMNQAIWSQVGGQFERQIRLEEPVRPNHNNLKDPTRKWWGFGRKKSRKEEHEMADLNSPKKDHAYKDFSRGRKHKRRQLLALIALATGLMTILPPLMAIGGDIIAHDFQFEHACDGQRWDILLDASGLQPERDNVFNRAVFKDRRGKGYEKAFMMNLEGMSSFGGGLDLTLVNQHRGYVFYLSAKDLSHQPDGGESVRFPYPVVVAYDMLKQTYFAHETVWRDLGDPSFFDNGAYMNGTLGVFPNEGIWLEKKEKDGFCGQPKRVLKNGYDQRILWTVVDSRKDCTLLRVCGSSQATRRQVVIATGTILLRLAVSANCCAKGNKAAVDVEEEGPTN